MSPRSISLPSDSCAARHSSIAEFTSICVHVAACQISEGVELLPQPFESSDAAKRFTSLAPSAVCVGPFPPTDVVSVPPKVPAWEDAPFRAQRFEKSQRLDPQPLRLTESQCAQILSPE